MAQVIQFPVLYEQFKRFDVVRNRCLLGLRFILDRIRTERVPVQKMFIVYESDETNTVSFMNIGFAPDELTKAIDEVLQSSEWE